MRQVEPAAFTAREKIPALAQGGIVGCKCCRLSGSELCRIVCDGSHSIGQAAKTRRFARGDTLVGQGDFPRFMGVLLSGYTRQVRLRLNGNHTVFGLACPGDIVGGVPGIAADYVTEASTDIEICTYDRVTVHNLMLESAIFRHFILREAGRQHQRLLEAAWRRNALGSRERIIAFLVGATKIMPTHFLSDGSLVMQIEVSRQDWASLTNTAVETVSRTMRYLAQMEMVTSLTPYKLHIKDIDKLALLAGVERPAGPLDILHRSD